MVQPCHVVFLVTHGNPRDIFEIFLLKQRENSLCFGVSPATSHHGSSPCILERLPGPSLCVLWELIQLGAADPEVPAPPCWEAGKRKRQGAEFFTWQALNSADQSPWHIAQRMQKPSHLKKWEKVGVNQKEVQLVYSM